MRRWHVWGVGGLLVVGLGTVHEQRNRLPPPVDPDNCADPVAGVWRSHTYEAHRGVWNKFVLTISRVEGQPELLTGRIDGEIWLGGAGEEQPGACSGYGDRHYHVWMDSRGKSTGLEVEFWGLDWTLDRVVCGTFTGYNSDHFAGSIDPDIQEFQTLNNDGGGAVNIATVFRRTSCDPTGADEPPKPSIALKPPPFQPPSAGCGLW